MERDYDETAPRRERVVERMVEGSPQVAEFLVDGDPECLKDACGWMRVRFTP